MADLPGTESDEGPVGDTQPTQPASPASLEASRAALAAALGGPVELGFVDGMPATIFDGRREAEVMKVDGTKARTAQD